MDWNDLEMVLDQLEKDFICSFCVCEGVEKYRKIDQNIFILTFPKC